MCGAARALALCATMGRHDLGRPGEPQGDINEMIERVNAANRQRYPDMQCRDDDAEEPIRDIIEELREIMRAVWGWRWRGGRGPARRH